MPAISEVASPHDLSAGSGQRERPFQKEHDSAISVRTAWWDYVSLLGSHVAFACLTVVGLALSARLLGPKEYGTVALFMGVIQLFFIIGVKWSFPAVLRFGRDALIRDGTAGQVVWAWLFLFAGSLTLCSLGLLWGSKAITRFVGPVDSPIGVYLIVLALTAVVMAAVQLLQMQGTMKVAAWAPVTSRFVFAGLLVVAIIWSNWHVTPTRLILLFAVALLVQALLSLPALRKQIFSPRRLDWGLTRTMARYAFPLWFVCVAGYVSEWVDLYVLRFFRGHAEVGVYQISYQAFLFLAGGLVGMYTLVFPLLTAWRAEGRQDRILRYAVRLIPQVGVLWGLLVLGLGIIQGPCFAMLFGSAFAMSGQVFSILLVSSAFQPLIFLYSPLFLTYDVPGRSTAVMVIIALVNVLGDLLLVRTFGSFGAAYATAASFAVGAWLCLAWGNRRLEIDHRAALIPSCLVAASLLTVAGQGLGIRMAVLLGAACVLVWWAQAYQVFSRDDLSMLEHVKCPRWVRRLITNVYTLLSARRPGVVNVGES